jgi:hypothetical protein
MQQFRNDKEKLSEHLELKTGKSFAGLMELFFYPHNPTNTNQASENAMKNQKIRSMEWWLIPIYLLQSNSQQMISFDQSRL